MLERDFLAVISGFVFQMILSVIVLGVRIMLSLVRG